MTQENASDKKKSKDLLSGVLVYGIGTLGSKIMVFLLVPLYTYYITTSDMGEYDLLHTTIGCLSPIVTLQLADAAFRWMVRDIDNQKQYIRSTLQVLIFNSFLVMSLIFLVNHFWAIPYCTYFTISLVTASFLATSQKLLRGCKSQWLFAVSGLIYTGVFLVLNIVQLCILKKGVESLFISTIIADVIALVFIFASSAKMRTNLIAKPDTVLLKNMLRFSVPLIPNYLNWWVINSSDRYIIRFFLDKAANGIYSISYKFPTLLQVILNLFNTSWQDVSLTDTDVDTGKYYSQVFERLYFFAFALLWPLIPITKLYILIMKSSYHSAASFVPFLYLGTVFQCFSSFYGVGYLRDKNTKMASVTSIVGAVVNAVVNIAFIRVIGLQAASISTFLGFAIMWLLREKQNRKSLGVKIRLSRFLPIFGVTLGYCVVTCYTTTMVDVVLLFVGGLAFLALNYRMLLPIAKKVLNKLHRR